MTSSTHGVEGFAGSGIQVGLLRDPDAPKPPPDTALLLIHTINPHGMAWLRRENEDNVDLNRNFVDHEGGNYPENDLFEELVEHLVPKVWDDDAYERYKAAIGVLNDRYGEGPGAQGDAQGPVPASRQHPLRRQHRHLVEPHPEPDLRRVSGRRATRGDDRRAHRSRPVRLRRGS